MPQNINCPKGCAPSSTGIGTAATTVVWIYTEGSGSITGVSGLPDPPFSGGQVSGNTYRVTYAGDTTPNASWGYQVTSSPTCPDDRKRENPVLTNGPGNR